MSRRSDAVDAKRVSALSRSLLMAAVVADGGAIDAITEASCESMPQCVLLQSYILTVVLHRTDHIFGLFGTASVSDYALASDATLLPNSIVISLVAILKTWVVDIVLEAGRKNVPEQVY